MKIRTQVYQLEPLIIFLAISAYITRSLFMDASKVDVMIRTVQNNGVSVNGILADLAHYDHTYNHNLPIIASAIFFFAGWYIFHQVLAPDFKMERIKLIDLAFLAIVFILLGISVFVFLNATELVFRHNSQGSIIGLHDISNFRKRYVVADTALLFTVILCYEFIFQTWQWINTKLFIDKRSIILKQVLLSFAFSLGIVGIMSSKVIHYLLFDQNVRITWSLILLFLLIIFLQKFYYQSLLLKTKNFQHQVFFTYFIVANLGAGLVIISLLRFDFNKIPLAIFSWTIIIAVPMIIAHYRHAIYSKESELETEISTQSAAISNLRAQINPHFLFNALNSIYAIALKENSEQTADGIQKLGDMMRFMLHENNRDSIALSSEIEYLHSYIAIQKMRIDPNQNIEIRVNLQEMDRELQIAPMLLNPFVENAFKHGISFQNPSWIYITLTGDAKNLYFKVHNSIHKTKGIDTEVNQGGIGQKNVKQRLQLLYPLKHTLEIQQSEKDYFVSLIINYQV